MSSYYDAAYFSWQSNIGEFGGWANSPRFSPYIAPSDCVLDFGCGGGSLLAHIDCSRRLGVEINDSARSAARTKGIEVYASAAEIPHGCVDKVISNHALEHTLSPLVELTTLKRTIRPGGLAIFTVPCESILCAYKPNIDHHLYTWSPLNLGNLFTEAGYKVIHSKALYSRWPPGYRHIAKLGRMPFDMACRIYGRLYRKMFQVHLVATV